MRAKILNFKGRVQSNGDARQVVESPGDSALVERGVLRSFVMRCPCGCGDVLTINLDPRADKAWRIYLRANGVSLFPSVWRDTDCGSHFIVWNDHICWSELDNWKPSQSELNELCSGILTVVETTEYISYVEIADRLEEIPWAIADAARHLVQQGELDERTGENRGWFRLKHHQI